MNRYIDIVLTAIAPVIWGTTFYVTTEFLPEGYPITAAILRALPAGFLLLLLVRRLPKGSWWWKLLLLGGLNFSVFWVMMFVSAYRLPGGVAATVGAMQPIFVIFFASLVLKSAISKTALTAAIFGVSGVALLVLNSTIKLDAIGLIAGFIGAGSMALGNVLTKRWQPPVSLLTFTAWQLTAGGLLLIPFALLFEPPLPTLTNENIVGFVWMGLAGAVISYFIWFRGISKIDVSMVSILGLLSPLTAVLLGWHFLNEELNNIQLVGIVVVIASVILGQYQGRSSKDKKKSVPVLALPGKLLTD